MKKETKIALIFLVIATIFVCLPLFNKDLDMTYDDGIQHISRLMGTYQSIEEGQKIPVIMSNFCNEFGYSWNLFYSPLTSFGPLIFKLLGLSFVTCIKLFMGISVFFSGYFMYKFAKKVSTNNKIGIIAGIAYLFMPYRLTDMFIRNAFAELVSFVFLPMIFLRIIFYFT